MAGIRASARGVKPNEQAGKLLRACLDLVEIWHAPPRR